MEGWTYLLEVGLEGCVQTLRLEMCKASGFVQKSIFEAALLLNALLIPSPPDTSERWEEADSSGWHLWALSGLSRQTSLIIHNTPLWYDLFWVHFMNWQSRGRKIE